MRCVPLSLVLLSTACASGVVDMGSSKDLVNAGESDGALDTDSPPGDSDDSGGTGPTDSGGSELDESMTLLEDSLTLDALLSHLDALQDVADNSGDTRQTFGEGFQDSVEYAVTVFERAGYSVTRQTFTVTGYEEGAPSELARTSPDPTTYAGSDIRALTYSGRGDVTAPLAAVDLVLPPDSAPNTSTSGCEASDFADFPAGAVALIQRGNCTFSEKATYAEAAGARAVILFNEGQAGRTEVESWTLDPSNPVSIPVLGTDFSVGEDLAASLADGAVEVRVFVDAGLVEKDVTNVLAERDVGDAGQLVVVGAHLDSVPAGPGINDNGSGTAFVLAAAEAAAQMDLQTDRRIRWALWGAEEIGLVGSDHYVSELSSAEKDAHFVNLNFDMIGSPNGGRFIYDGDGSATGTAGPAGSDTIEALFQDWFESQGLTHAPTAFDGRSDYGPFIWAGIPAGGLFTGAEAAMSSTEAELFGGRAGEALDACYHQSCDDRANIDETLFFEMSLAAAHVTQMAALSSVMMGMPGPERRPVARVELHDLPQGHGHGHGHGCHPVAR